MNTLQTTTAIFDLVLFGIFIAIGIKICYMILFKKNK